MIILSMILDIEVLDSFQAVKFGGNSKDCEETVLGGKPLARRICV